MNSQTAALSRHAKPATTGPLAGVVHAVSSCIAWIRRRWLVRRNVELLSALDDKMLADIGLVRDQVEYVARLGHLPDRR
jgi:uncharacterized protein YjiS (DUF1127 family)